MNPVSLTCSNHNSSLINYLDLFKAVDSFVDVTLVCEGHTVKAHKVILAAGSNVLRRLLLANPSKHPILVLAETKYDTLRLIIEFLYKGRVDIPRNDLHKVLQFATTFEIIDLKKLCEESLNSEKGDNDPSIHSFLKSPVSCTSSPKKKKQRRQSSDSDILIHDTVLKTDINFSACRLEQSEVSSFADNLSVIAPTELDEFHPQISNPRSVFPISGESSAGIDPTGSSVQKIQDDSSPKFDILYATTQTELTEFHPQISNARSMLTTSVESSTPCNLNGSSDQQILKDASTECNIPIQKELKCHCLPINPARAAMKPRFTEISGDISVNSQSRIPLREADKDINLTNQLLQSFEKLQTEMMEVNNKVETVLNKFTGQDYTVTLPEPIPPGITLPIDSDKSLIELNNKLQDTELLTSLIRYLHTAGSGNSLRKFFSSMLKKLLTKKVAVLYSRLGRKGKKCFMSLEQVLKAILTAASLKFPKALKDEIELVFGKALAGAADWEGKNNSSPVQDVKPNIELWKTA